MKRILASFPSSDCDAVFSSAEALAAHSDSAAVSSAAVSKTLMILFIIYLLDFIGFFRENLSQLL